TLFGKLSQSSRDVSDILEQGVTVGLMGDHVANEIISNPTLLGRVFGHLPSIRDWKDRAQLAQIVKEHPDLFKNSLAKMQPDLVRIMQDSYGTRDWSKISVAWARERLSMAEDPSKMTSVFRAVRPKPVGADAVTIDNAFQYALELSARASKQTQFFQPERSWLLRTINHPFLGLYPAAYMWGHVLPEFSRFLLLRPFGLHVPLAGAAALMNVQREMAAEFADPQSGIGKFVADHPESMYILNQLLPGDPTSLGANAPLAVRHAINGKLTAAAVAQNPETSLGLNFGALRDITAGAKLANELTKKPPRNQPQSLTELMDQSAAQYNAWVLPSLQKSVSAADQAVMDNL
ncbi:MAG: hypothetical protein KGR26_16505, partial [Cyanobacteria bacterium REEB65]|nr:hypothetical protein [Cyanobacteria bacterium REEB65]